MRIYTVVIIQFMVWSGFSFIEWLSTYDGVIYKTIMFLIFFYLAVMFGNQIIQSTKKTMFTTLVSLCLYSVFHILMTNIW